MLLHTRHHQLHFFHFSALSSCLGLLISICLEASEAANTDKNARWNERGHLADPTHPVDGCPLEGIIFVF